MQRKTLVRVLGLEGRVGGLEGRVSELELQQAAEEQAKEGIDEILNDIHEAKEEEVGGTKTKTKPKAKAKPKVKPKAKKTRVKGKRIRKPKIDADKFKRGTSQETVEERLERQNKNRQETAAAEEHKKTDEYKETTTATDEKGEYLSPEERKARFKAKFIPKTEFDSKDIKPETEAEIGDDSKKDKIVTFLNGDVKDNLDDVRDDLKQIEGLLKDQNKSADDQYEEMRQGILTAKKKKREEDLEGKDKKPGGGGLKDKMLDAITKPAGSFFNKIIKFITYTLLGSVVNNLLAIIKDPSRLLDPIRKFFNVLIGLFNAMSKMMWKITGAPINGIIEGINNGAKGIIDGVNSVTQKLNLPPLTWKGIPLIPGPPEVPMIPLSETGQAGQAKNEGAVAMAGGGVVPEMSMNQQIMQQTDYNEDGSISVYQATPEERHAQFKKMGLPSMELWDGSVVPDFGKMGADSFMKGIQMVREGMVNHPDKIKIIDDFMATNPYAQPEKLQSMINRVVPGSQEQVYGDLGDSITASAKMSGGGIVQGFQGGGRVRGKSKMYNIKSKEPKNTVIAYEQEVNKEQQKSAPASGGNEIPSFDVAPIRDPHKMTTLQIVLF